jgi:hypothetical protein
MTLFDARWSMNHGQPRIWDPTAKPRSHIPALFVQQDSFAARGLGTGPLIDGM